MVRRNGEMGLRDGTMKKDLYRERCRQPNICLHDITHLLLVEGALLYCCEEIRYIYYLYCDKKYIIKLA